MQFLQPNDLAPFADIDPAKAAAMVEDAEAMAALTAPCITDLDPDHPGRGTVKAVLRTAVLRWNDAGSGAIQQVSAGPFQQSVQTQSRRAMFLPSEIDQLRNICRPRSGKAFSVDTAPTIEAHPHWCTWHTDATRCTCGMALIDAG